jgi:hypothetical protein
MESAFEIAADLSGDRPSTPKKGRHPIAGLKGVDTAAVSGKRRQFSRIANGRVLMPTAKGTSVWARLMREALGSLMQHAGGADMVSETQKLAARRVAFLEAELIYLENEIALAREKGLIPDANKLALYGMLADRQRRLAGEALGWNRAARDITPSLYDIAAEIHAARPKGDAS